MIARYLTLALTGAAMTERYDRASIQCKHARKIFRCFRFRHKKYFLSIEPGCRLLCKKQGILVYYFLNIDYLI